MMRRRRAGLVVVLAALISGACAPKPAVQVGLKDYNTDIVFGSKKKPAPPPPVPAAEPTPGFPGFIEPPPPPAIRALPTVETVPTTASTLPPRATVACPEASINQIPPEATADLQGLPKPGRYTYRVTGENKVDDATTPLPAVQVREVKILDPAEGAPGWQVAITTGDSVVTTTYRSRHVSDTPDVDGIYITQIVMQKAGASPEEFTPTDLGLRIFALPAGLGTSWTSAATDPIHSTSMRLSATETQKRRINACGTVAEGWDSVISGDIVGVAANKSLHIEATYLVAPQFGGLIIADDVKLTGTDGSASVTQEVHATVNSLNPS